MPSAEPIAGFEHARPDTGPPPPPAPPHQTVLEYARRHRTTKRASVRKAGGVVTFTLPPMGSESILPPVTFLDNPLTLGESFCWAVAFGIVLLISPALAAMCVGLVFLRFLVPVRTPAPGRE